MNQSAVASLWASRRMAVGGKRHQKQRFSLNRATCAFPHPARQAGMRKISKKAVHFLIFNFSTLKPQVDNPHGNGTRHNDCQKLERLKMIDLNRGNKTLRADWPGAMFDSGLEVALNLSTLAAHLGDTRARIEAMVARGIIPIAFATDDGKPLFRMGELESYREAYRNELLILGYRSHGVSFTSAQRPAPATATVQDAGEVSESAAGSNNGDLTPAPQPGEAP